MLLVVFVFLSLLSLSSLCPSSSVPTATTPAVANHSSCPMDFKYVLSIAKNSTACQNYKPPETDHPKISKSGIPCCRALLKLYGIALARHLNETSLFNLPNFPTSVSCLNGFRSMLARFSVSNSLSLSDDVVPYCLDPLQFITTRNTCDGIQSTQDLVSRLGRTTVLDSACRSDLTDLTACDKCISACFKVHAELTSRDGNSSHSPDCWYVTILYAAGVVNEFGPESNGAVSCIFGLSKESRESKTLSVVLVGAIVSIATFILCNAPAVYYWRRKRGDRENIQGNQELVPLFDIERQIAEFLECGQFREDERKGIDVPFVALECIRAATGNFSEANRLGQGGFGPVYKGKFQGGQEIAVKRLSSGSGQGLQEFKNEVLLIAKLQHRNLVRLLGYCVDGDEKLLLYEYMPNKSLDSFIFDRTLCVLLNWKIRFNIILGIARGVAYLHHDSRLKIIHRDLKTSNILLDGKMNPKISDFGLAKIFGGKDTEENTTRVVGTYGYMSPEYALDGFFSIKSDVFSFGVIVLEIISGKRNRKFYQSELASGLVGYAWKLWKENKPLDLMDITLCETCNVNEFLRCINVGLLCVQDDPNNRPTMSNVVFMLGGETMMLPSPRQPVFAARRFHSSSGSSSKPLSVNDLTDTLEQGR
ncbi:Serine/threonine protein kinase [Parasponia andersonii]|uniref:non-specific serine/threonine protein kinase n=1 Tax=Parasponia andersonii TaxID=3476 RepID=A0A2P5E4N2_PARAD|nr:Serine/threonine protein kinase [Parasponia andersonii]